MVAEREEQSLARKGIRDSVGIQRLTFEQRFAQYWRKINMTTRINSPIFNKSKNYERFRQELTTWKEITDLSKDKQCIVIALSIPEDDESKIREKGFDQIPVSDLKTDDGLTVLLIFWTNIWLKMILRTAWKKLRILRTLKEQMDSQ